jgi:hypothetical protein
VTALVSDALERRRRMLAEQELREQAQADERPTLADLMQSVRQLDQKVELVLRAVAGEKGANAMLRNMVTGSTVVKDVGASDTEF